MAQRGKKNPKQDPQQVAAINQQINRLLKTYQSEIEQGHLTVFVIDECHLMSGDICGYGWGDTQTRRTIDVQNYRERQTYYGAVDLLTGELFLQKAPTADTTHTISFIKYLQSQRPNSRLLIIW